MLPIRELVVPLSDAGRAAEVVDRDRRDPPLGEAERQLLVEPVEAADIREDDDPGAARRLRKREERREPRPVARLELEVAMVDRRARDDRDGRLGVVLEAHRQGDDTVDRSETTQGGGQA
jgi:hypothetical protein